MNSEKDIDGKHHEWHELDNPLDEVEFGYIANKYKATAGQMLKAIRILCGFEQKEVAYKIGAKQGVISKWELNLSTPSTEFLQPLASLYCIDVITLLKILAHKG